MLTLYLDASALVKRYVEEDGSDLVIEAMSRARAWAMCRIGYVETVRAVDLAGGRRALKRVDSDWLAFTVVEVDAELAERAAELARSVALRSLDALHLAAGLMLPADNVTFATWDARLHRAAAEQGLQLLPESIG